MGVYVRKAAAGAVEHTTMVLVLEEWLITCAKIWQNYYAEAQC
jgi:hypothetical protein